MQLQKLNQSEVSKLTGVRQDKISRIVRNQNRISLQDFVKMGEVLDPEFIEEFYKRAGYDLKYYINYFTENSIKGDTYNRKSPVAQLMLDYNKYASLLSHPFPPAPSYFPNVPQDDSIPACIYDSKNLWFCFPDGVRGTPSLIGNINQIKRDFQLEYRMD